jgi:hypothetical protein
MSSEGPKFNDTNVFRVRRDTRLNQGLFLTKLVLKKHGSAQIEGMGETISLVSKFAQILVKDNLASISNIRSENVERGDRKSINPKLVITLKKSADFDKLTEGLVLKS